MGYLAKSLSMFLYSDVYGSLHDVLFDFPERQFNHAVYHKI